VHLAGVVLLIAIGSGLFSTFSLIIACIVRTRERFMGIGQVLTMPIFFASNAIYPIDLMPHWLQIVSRLNPLTYEVDALRALMLRGGDPVLGFAVDFAVLLVALAAAIMVAARMLRRMAA
jgi:ABC-2 type transport system permease protein